MISTIRRYAVCASSRAFFRGAAVRCAVFCGTVGLYGLLFPVGSSAADGATANRPAPLQTTFPDDPQTVATAETGEKKGGKSENLFVYIGTYTGGKSRGIYLLTLDLSTGRLKNLGVVAELKNPSFLALHPSGNFLYAVSEVETTGGKRTGGVRAYAIDRSTGRLKLLNGQISGGRGPCHLVVDHSGRAVLVANYSSGSVASIPLGEDGRLLKPASIIQHKGSSVNPRRQKGPHGHSINVDPGNHFAVAADLGLDQLLVYRFDTRTGKLTPNQPPFARVAPGSGPRHFAFHPTGKFAYVINEMKSTVTAFRYDGQKGILTALQTLSTLPKNFRGNNSTAEVQVHPSGRFLYGSNRGHNSIAIFAIDQKTGRLTPRGHQPTGGKTPRNFGIDPTGRYLLAANQQSDNIVVFRIDRKTGQLKPTGQSLTIPNPVCVKFLQR